MTDKTSSCFMTVLPNLSGVLLVRRDHLRPLRCVRRLLPSRPLALHPLGVFRLLLGPQLPGVSYTGSSGLGSYHGVSYTGSSGLGSYLGVSYTGSSGLGSSSDFCWVPLPAWTAALGSRLTPPRLLILGSRLAALGPRSRLVAYSTPALGSWVLGSRL